MPRNSAHPYRRSDYVTEQIDEIIEALEQHDADTDPNKISRMAFFNQRYHVAQNRLAEAKKLNDAWASWRNSSRWTERRGAFEPALLPALFIGRATLFLLHGLFLGAWEFDFLRTF